MLAVQQMAGSIVRRALVTWGRAIAESDCLKLLTDVPYSRRKFFRALSVARIVREQMSIRNKHGAASATVRYHRRVSTRTRSAKGVDVLPRQLARAFQIAGMRVQSSATNLGLRRTRAATICFQDSLGSFIYPLEQSLRHTALEKDGGRGRNCSCSPGFRWSVRGPRAGASRCFQ